MATHFTGPVRNRARVDGDRAFFSNLPVGHEPDLIEYFNDFLFSKDYVAADWVVTETDAGATQAIAADVTGGALLLTNTATENDILQLQSAEEWFKLTSGKRAWFECRFKVSDATEQDLFIGFATTDTSIIAGTTDSIGFRKLDGSTSLLSITEDNTSETTNAAATLADDTFVTVSFYYDGQSSVSFYLKDSAGNRNLTATHTSNIEVTNKLALTFTLMAGEGAAETMSIDYVYVALER
jgi:hypothetical protein